MKAKRLIWRFRRWRLGRLLNSGGRKRPIYKFKSGDRVFLSNDEISYTLFATGDFENNNRRLWECVVRPGNVVFDVGANWGLYTLAALRLTSGNGMVVAFEPNQTESKKLLDNLTLMSQQVDRNFVLRHEALGDYTGHTTFHVPSEFKGAYGSIKRPDVNTDFSVIEVPITTIDVVFEQEDLKSLDVLKIDVEGNELNVLNGAVNTLRTFAPFIFIEVSDRRTKAYGYKARELCDLLLQHGYRLYVPFGIDGTGRALITRFTPSDYISYVDVFAVPERVEEASLSGLGIEVVDNCS